MMFADLARQSSGENPHGNYRRWAPAAQAIRFRHFCGAFLTIRFSRYAEDGGTIFKTHRQMSTVM
jgi:hypothetical protein